MLKRSWLSLAVAAAGAAAVLSSCASAQEVKSGLVQPDMGTIPDGAYEGHYFLFPVDVKVITRVSDGKISEIDLVKHFNGKGESAEAIIPVVIERQSLRVDVISGATHSSVTILKAIEDSLNKGAHAR